MPNSGGTPGCLYEKYVNTGRVIICSLNGLKFTESVLPAMISNGAVSPITRAMPIVIPVMSTSTNSRTPLSPP